MENMIVKEDTSLHPYPPYIIDMPIVLTAKKVGGRNSKSKGTKKCLILRPKEYNMILNHCNEKYKALLPCMLFTGMRYAELKRLQKHMDWVNDQFITMPAHLAQKKAKRVDPDRWIRLSYAGREAVKRLPTIKLPSYAAFKQYMKYNFDIPYFTSKSLRKTYESWLVSYFENREYLIAQSQGHTMITQFKHYLSLPFSQEDKIAMKPFVEGWL